LNKKTDRRGTWKGTLLSDWVDPSTNKGPGPINVYLVIRQTYSTIDVRLFSEESNSVSLSGNISRDRAEVCSLAVVYQNTSKMLRRDGSPINPGGMLLTLVGAPVHKLDGEYWTDRKNIGELTLNARSNKIVHDFEEALKLKVDAENSG
jgi:hypothetical protein